MLKRLASTAFLAAALLALSLPVTGFAQRGGRSGGGHAYSGASRGYAPRGAYGGSPRGYSRGAAPAYRGGGYLPSRSYGRPIYRGYYGRGVYPGYGVPYGNYYAPSYGYGYDPYYYAAPPAPACGGTYDQYGNWIPAPNCYSGQPYYPQ